MLNAAAFAFMVVRLSNLMSFCIFLKGSSKGRTGFFPASYVQVWRASPDINHVDLHY